MAGAARLNDQNNGACTAPPSTINSGSGNVIINGRGAARLGDTCAPHARPNQPAHTPSVSVASATVLINGRGAARLGDAVGCGSTISTGSGNVIIG